jgi:hypothetical protein
MRHTPSPEGGRGDDGECASKSDAVKRDENADVALSVSDRYIWLSASDVCASRAQCFAAFLNAVKCLQTFSSVTSRVGLRL